MAELASASDGGLYRLGFGGDTFNATWYARQALPGAFPVAYLTALGGDTLSVRMLDMMAGAGIDMHLIGIREDVSCGLYLVETEGGERSFRYWREASAARGLVSELGRLPADLETGDTLLFSGITLAIIAEDDREILLEYLARARKSGCTVAFDPNVRPSLWPSIAELRHWLMRGAATASHVLVSAEDHEIAFGPGDNTVISKRYLGAGSDLVVVKSGASDVLVARSDGSRVSVPVREIAHPIDTTAAGDCFDGVFLGLLMLGWPIQKAASAATLASAEVIMHSGALHRLPDLLTNSWLRQSFGA